MKSRTILSARGGSSSTPPPIKRQIEYNKCVSLISWCVHAFSLLIKTGSIWRWKELFSSKFTCVTSNPNTFNPKWPSFIPEENPTDVTSSFFSVWGFSYSLPGFNMMIQLKRSISSRFHGRKTFRTINLPFC